VVWVAVVLDGLPEDADWPNRRVAANTIHAIGDSTGPTGPPARPNGVASALSTAVTNPGAGAEATAGVLSANATVRAVLTADTAAAGTGVDALAVWRDDDDGLGVLDVLSESVEDEWDPPLDETVDVGLAFFTGLDDSPAESTRSEPAGFFARAGRTAEASPSASASSLRSVSLPVLSSETLAGGSAAPDDPDAVPALGEVALPEAADPEVEEPDAEGDPDEPLPEDVSESGSAQAIAGIAVTADPMPSATANAPIRPMYLACSMSPPNPNLLRNARHHDPRRVVGPGNPPRFDRLQRTLSAQRATQEAKGMDSGRRQNWRILPGRMR
jgi:hypothetical protein